MKTVNNVSQTDEKTTVINKRIYEKEMEIVDFIKMLNSTLYELNELQAKANRGSVDIEEIIKQGILPQELLDNHYKLNSVKSDRRASISRQKATSDDELDGPFMSA